MDSFSDLIGSLGGSAAVSRGINERQGTVRQWRLRNSIPPEYWPRIVSFAKDHQKPEVTLEVLVNLAQAKAAA